MPQVYFKYKYFLSSQELLLIACTFVTNAVSFINTHSNGITDINQLVSPTESYIGPSSYATSFQSNNHDYPSFGNFGYLMNMKNPQITSAYTAFGPSDENDFSSTSYINYPSSTSTIHENTQQNYKSPLIESSYSSAISHDSPSFSFPPNLSSLFSSTSNQEVPISQHIEVTRPVAVPVYKKFPYPVSKDFHVPIPHPVLVPYPAPYPGKLFFVET